MHAAYSVSNLGTAGAAPATHTVPAGSAGRAGLPSWSQGRSRVWSESHLAHTRPICHVIRRPPSEVFALLADIQEAEPLHAALSYAWRTTQPGKPRSAGLLHDRETLRPVLLPWLPAIIAPRLRPHIVERLTDIRDLWEMPEGPGT